MTTSWVPLALALALTACTTDEAVPTVDAGFDPVVTDEARRGDATSTFTWTVTGEVAEYGSTYNTSCTCSYCSMWCSTKSGIVYSGSCC